MKLYSCIVEGFTLNILCSYMELVYHSPLKHPDTISHCIYISLYQSALSSLYCMSGFTGIETPVWFAHLWLICLQTGVKFHFLPGSPGNTPPLTCVILCIRVAVHLKLASVAFIANGGCTEKNVIQQYQRLLVWFHPEMSQYYICSRERGDGIGVRTSYVVKLLKTV